MVFLKTHPIIYYIMPIPYIYKYWEQTDKHLPNIFYVYSIINIWRLPKTF